MSATPTQDADEYVPGVCNIGQDEIDRRRRFGHLAAASAAGLLGLLLVLRAPRLSRLLVALPAMGAASGYLQARERFCAGYGHLGVYNFGPAGHPTPVADEAARDADRRKARQISLQATAIGAAAGLASLLLPD